jgi:hypothetical protein
MVQPDELFLAAFFDHAQTGALAFEPIILQFQSGHGADARKRVENFIRGGIFDRKNVIAQV